MSSAGTAAARDRGDVTGPLAAGLTDPGKQREVNEDRLLCDPERGAFAVIDGVGGQAAGGTAADVALSLMKEALRREPDSDGDCIRVAITDANNEIYRLAATRPEWDGMACVLTLALVANGKVTFGHVGDTRLYKLRGNRIEKLTRDHSPVGEREDANEISERQAMRHPRRNEVYRDVGSEFHDRRDRDFIDIREVPFEPDAALLLCSDGLTDLVDSTTIAETISKHAGNPSAVVRDLIAAANAAGGKDNVTVVYVEGDSFSTSQFGRGPIQSGIAVAVNDTKQGASQNAATSRSRLWLSVAALAIAAIAGTTMWARGWTLADVRALVPTTLRSAPVQRTVAPGDSIEEAMRDAPPGSEIVVEPGEYREQITLREGVRLVSKLPNGATIRLPAAVRDGADVAAVVARNVSGASIVNFRVSGDSATPLPTGIVVQNSTVSIINVEITGATRAAVEFAGGGASTLMASDIRDNDGLALIIRDGARPAISHNTFARNSKAAHGAPVLIERAAPAFSQNVFVAAAADSFAGLDSAARAEVMRGNWFVSAQPPSSGR